VPSFRPVSTSLVPAGHAADRLDRRNLAAKLPVYDLVGKDTGRMTDADLFQLPLNLTSDRISDRLSKERADPVERILKNTTVIVNESHITKASYRNYDTSDGPRNDLTIELTDEGRRRLWKYSMDKVGTQVLVVADGVAIEAPKIRHILAEGELEVTQIRDKLLVQDAVERINKHTSPSK